MSESDERDGADVLKSLPARRPQRRSARRDGAKPAAAQASAKAGARAAAKPKAGGPKPVKAKPATPRAKAATPRAKAAPPSGKPKAVRPSAATRNAASTPSARPADSPEGIELVGTAIQAVGELAQLGLTLGTKALRGAVSRIPRP